MKNFYFLMLLGASILMSSCNKKEEVVGPQGTAGTNGTNGTDGLNAFLTQGSISGKITGTRGYDDEPIDESFNYNIYFSQEESKIETGEGYAIHIARYALDYENYMRISIYSSDLSEQPDSTNFDIDFSYSNPLSDSTYFKFGLFGGGWFEQASKSNARYFSEYDGDSRLTISNYSYNSKTGQLKFDYKIDVAAYENTSWNDAVVEGSVDVQVKREVYKAAATN